MITSGLTGQGNEDPTARLCTLGWEGLYGTTVSLTIWTKLPVPECCKGQQLPLGWGLGPVEGPYGGQQGRFWQTEPDPPHPPQPSTGAAPDLGIGQLHRDQPGPRPGWDISPPVEGQDLAW